MWTTVKPPWVVVTMVIMVLPWHTQLTWTEEAQSGMKSLEIVSHVPHQVVEIAVWTTVKPPWVDV